MSRAVSRPTWPLIWLLAGLLILCLTAPRSWELPARLQVRGNAPADHSLDRSLPAQVPELPEGETRQAPAADVEPARQVLPGPPAGSAPAGPVQGQLASIEQDSAASSGSASPELPRDEACHFEEPDGTTHLVVAIHPDLDDIYRRHFRPRPEPYLSLASGGLELRIALVRLMAQAEVREALESERFAWRPSRDMPGPMVIDPNPPEPVAPLAPFDLTVEAPSAARAEVPAEALIPVPVAVPPATAPTARVVEARPRWPQPGRLLERVGRWHCDPLAGAWASRVESSVAELFAAHSAGDEMEAVLDDLAGLASQAAKLAERASTASQATELRRTGYSLSQHVDTWKLAQALNRQVPEVPARRGVLAQLPANWPAAWLALEGSSSESWSTFWQNYLIWEALRAAGDARSTESSAGPASGTVAGSAARQGGDDAAHTSAAALLENWESFDRQPSSTTARSLAEMLVGLRRQNNPELKSLLNQVEEDLRGMNLRICLNGQLLAQLSTDRAPMVQAVRQTVQGVPVRGSSVTTSNIQFRLVPDPDQLRVAIEAQGQIASRTSSRTGPAMLWNKSDASYQVRKVLSLSLDGVEADPAEVLVNSSTRLRGVESSLDWVPVLGRVTRGIIRNQYEVHRPLAHRETQKLLRQEIGAGVERETQGQLAELNRQLHERLQLPLERLGFEPLVQAETTAQRLTLRVRLATDQQLAAHSPRPRAPGDSWASVQIHESAANNLVQQLQLDGQRMHLADLYARIVERLNLPSERAPESMPRDVFVTFAAHDSARVSLDEGRVKLTLRLAEVNHKSEHWRNFEVYVFYRPDLSVPHGQMVRDGVVQLAGRGLRARGQVALRGIFSRVFAKDKPLSLWPAVVAEHERLNDLVVNQLVVEDGWIGWALGPQAKPAATPPASDAAAVEGPLRRKTAARMRSLTDRIVTRRAATPDSPVER